MRTALILSGGGARAAYQVGVLRGLVEIIGPDRQPFEVICGTSAGAINAAYLAAYADRPGEGVMRMFHAWRALHASDIYDTTWAGVWRSLVGTLYSALAGRESDMPQAVLDNEPLHHLLARWLDFTAIRRNIAAGKLRDLCITVMNYSSGESVAFHEGIDATHWERIHRRGVPVELCVDHILASAAIPILFPPHQINGHYFGDGALRQLHPLSPALHLGADRLFIVGVSANRRLASPLPEVPPTVAQMAGHLLNREFIDNLEADIEHSEKINKLLARGSTDQARPIEILVITPSIAFDDVAARYIRRQPRSMRLLFRMLGARGRGAGASFASYLLFDGGFCEELIEAGYQDAWENETAIRKFFPDGAAGVAPDNSSSMTGSQ
jgi:NTE family protein